MENESWLIEAYLGHSHQMHIDPDNIAIETAAYDWRCSTYSSSALSGSAVHSLRYAGYFFAF